MEVKGLIASSYLVISSRFHGVASSLNSCVPCLATSWNHKYAELYKDFGIDGYLFPLEDEGKCISMMNEMLDEAVNTKIREELARACPDIKKQVQNMWKQIWAL